MMRLGIGTLLLLLMSPTSIKAAPAWVVRPNICLADKASDICTMTITIEAKSLQSNQKYCLFLGETLIDCWIGARTPSEVNVRLDADKTLMLVDNANQVVLSETLEVKARYKQKTRRRIRQPWSLF